jgi:putative transposase
MPRSNRYILPGYAYHVTHRCHNRSFLFRFAKDRNEYRERLRMALKSFQVKLLNYSITSNHTHLLLTSSYPEELSAMMQKLEGEFAEYYNIRKKRRGAFWDGRFHCTMVDRGEYVWNCMKYIDMNMVWAGVVEDPREWEWCGYAEIVGLRKRYRLLDKTEAMKWVGETSPLAFARNYALAVDEAVANHELLREPMWTESIAVGRESFIQTVEERTTRRREFTVSEAKSGCWTVRESSAPYVAFSAPKTSANGSQRTTNMG